MTTAAAHGVEVNLLDLFQTLGIEQVHIAAGGPPVLTDWQGLAIRHAERIASLTLPSPPILDTAELAGVASRLLILAGDQGTSARPNCSRIFRTRNRTSCAATTGNRGRT